MYYSGEDIQVTAHKMRLFDYAVKCKNKRYAKENLNSDCNI